MLDKFRSFTVPSRFFFHVTSVHNAQHVAVQSYPKMVSGAGTDAMTEGQRSIQAIGCAAANAAARSFSPGGAATLMGSSPKKRYQLFHHGQPSDFFKEFEPQFIGRCFRYGFSSNKYQAIRISPHSVDSDPTHCARDSTL